MMVLICDKCGKEIPLVEEEILGIKSRYYRKGRVKYSESIFNSMDLCEECADKIRECIEAAYKLFYWKIHNDRILMEEKKKIEKESKKHE